MTVAATNLQVSLRLGPLGPTVRAACALSYAAPLVSATQPAAVPTTGSPPAAMLTLLGANFRSFPGTAAGRAVALGPYPCGPVQWTSDSSLACRAPGPGSGSGIPAAVTVGGLESAAASPGFRYAAPAVTAVTRLAGPASALSDCGAAGLAADADAGLLPTEVRPRTQACRRAKSVPAQVT